MHGSRNFDLAETLGAEMGNIVPYLLTSARTQTTVDFPCIVSKQPLHAFNEATGPQAFKNGAKHIILPATIHKAQSRDPQPYWTAMLDI